MEGLEVTSLLFADDVVHLTLSWHQQDFKHTLKCFAAECEAAAVKISTYVQGHGSLLGMSGILPTDEARDLTPHGKCKSLGILIMRDRKRVGDIYKQQCYTHCIGLCW